MLKTYEYRLYPTKKQEELLKKHFGCARFVYNKILEMKINEKSGSYTYFCRKITEWKHSEEFSFLKEVSIASLQFAAQHVMNSYNNFFNIYFSKYVKEKDIYNKYSRIALRKYRKNKEYPFTIRDMRGYPKFKSLKDKKQSYSVIGHCYVEFEKNRIRIPKFQEGIKARIDRVFDGQVRTCTVKKSNTGKYFIDVLVEDGQCMPSLEDIEARRAIGIDLGISKVVTCSDGQKFDNYRFFKKDLNRLRCLNRKAAKQVKGSNNQQKTYNKIRRIYEKITNRKKDYIHKITYKLTHDSQVGTICMEDLNILGMLKNHRLAQSILEAMWGTFRKQIEYKCKWNGKNLLFVSRFYPSSKTCSSCGFKKEDLSLADRAWKCPKCGVTHDRDINAALNIKNEALFNILNG